MNCDLILNSNPDIWVREESFLLWEIGAKRVIEHWADHLFQSNGTLTIWMEEPDANLIKFINCSFPLCQRCSVCLGTPDKATDACTFLTADGTLVVRTGEEITPALPDQPAMQTWFAMVRRWLEALRSNGSHIPELEEEVHSGVFVGHHCQIDPAARFIAPCWVGSCSTIHAATIGPFAVVGEGCQVASGVRMTESLLLGGTFVGRGLHLDGVVAGAGTLMEHQSGNHVRVLDDLMLRRLAA